MELNLLSILFGTICVSIWSICALITLLWALSLYKSDPRELINQHSIIQRDEIIPLAISAFFFWFILAVLIYVADKETKKFKRLVRSQNETTNG